MTVSLQHHPRLKAHAHARASSGTTPRRGGAGGTTNPSMSSLMMMSMNNKHNNVYHNIPQYMILVFGLSIMLFNFHFSSLVSLQQNHNQHHPQHHRQQLSTSIRDHGGDYGGDWSSDDSTDLQIVSNTKDDIKKRVSSSNRRTNDKYHRNKNNNNNNFKVGGLSSSKRTSASTFKQSDNDDDGSGLLRHSMIQQSLLLEAPWAESHGADHKLYLGAGLLYYSFVYSFQCQTVVVLGSGGGFVPRMIRQAQRDLMAAGIAGNYKVILIDAHLASAGYGSTFYAENDDTVMRRQYDDIRYIFKTTDDAYEQLAKEGIQIDYLHVDADHTFEQSWKDFENYSTLLTDRAVVSFHDTCRSKKRNCGTGVPRALDRLRHGLFQYNLQLIDAHYLYRGIAFAITRSAPQALEPPPHHKLNFCLTNARNLNKSSPGWTLNKKVGTLPTLGDYYQCKKRFDLPALKEPCPFGMRRDKRGTCNLCIPGMIGDQCQEYKYQQLRPSPTNSTTSTAPSSTTRIDKTILRIISDWIIDRESQHIFEFGINSDSSHTVSHHLQQQQQQPKQGTTFQSVLVVDPKVDQPIWSDDGSPSWNEHSGADKSSSSSVSNERPPSSRWLPCKTVDVLQGLYSSVVTLNHIDTLVCLDCDQRIPHSKGFHRMMAFALTGSRTVVLEGNPDSKLFQGFGSSKSLPMGWTIETDLTLSVRRGGKGGTTKEQRRLLLLTKSRSSSKAAAVGDGNQKKKAATSGAANKASASSKTNKKAQTTTTTSTTTKRQWKPEDFALSDFKVAGVNLAEYQLGQEGTVDDFDKYDPPYKLFDNFDLTKHYDLTGRETWEDLVRLRRDVKDPTLSFYVDKVARRRWLSANNYPTPKASAVYYRSELTKTGDPEDEPKAILRLLQNQTKDNPNYVAKSTHLSCSAGVWLLKKVKNQIFIGHGSKKMKKAQDGFDLDQIAESLANDLHEGPRCGRQQESWALEQVQPGVMIEERFAAVDDGDDDCGGMEFKVITIWGRVWLAQWRPGVSKVQAFVHRNGTTLNWEEDQSDPLPKWIDWSRIVALAEKAGAHKDMFRTDIFVGVPAGTVPEGSSRQERLAAAQYVISETEIHPTPIKGTSELFQEAGRLWLAGYKLGNYKIVSDTDVPKDFWKNASLPGSETE